MANAKLQTRLCENSNAAQQMQHIKHSKQRNAMQQMSEHKKQSHRNRDMSGP